ncbi:hypothetical protein G3N55_07540 [Dissulfurirhabdus thermomarina]|uniref:Uncharacterized protein n=1 Tax=Dissulfurirhabdus thermomarina TaxID=1765737 RepID=A0A6N9TN23_DISTH|nr:hypothetical protein [Dissulfurirhabdus thermomarina]NDY42691.1 hypothetical protein [Dissulfurirhabdus thermomarina]NMX24302.1 hypothetical protein [Dissulfurirhabdus thermomarina]
MSINMHLREIVGERIKAVVVARMPSWGTRHIYLVFEDGDGWFEIYGRDVHNAKGARGGGFEVLGKLLSGAENVWIYQEGDPVPPLDLTLFF